MSFFLGDATQYSHLEVDPEKVRIAEIQFYAVSTTFNKVLQKCRDKCIIPEYGEGELSTGESSCLDRCVAKYVKTNAFIGSTVQSSLRPETMPEYHLLDQRLQRNHK